MKVFLRLLHYCKPYHQFIIPYFTFTFLATFFGLLNFTLIIPLLDVLFGTEKVIEDATKPVFSISLGYFKDIFSYYFYDLLKNYSRLDTLKIVCCIIVASVMISNFFKYLTAIRIEYFKTHIVKSLRNIIFEKYTTLDISYFSNNKKGDLITRTISDSIEVETSLSSSFAAIFSSPISLTMYFSVLFMISAKLTFFTLLIIPISGGLISLLVKKLRKQAKESFESFGTLNSTLEETLSFIKIIKAFGAQRFINDKFKNQNEQFTSIARKIIRRKEFASPFSEFSGIMVISFILIYGGSLVLGDTPELTASAFITYITIFSQVLKPAKELSNAFIMAQRGLAAGERIIELLDTKIEVKESESAVLKNDFITSIQFSNINFSYNKKQIIKDFNLSISKGQMVGLVGPSGGGKSTLADLLMRFYDANQGQILIDGMDISLLKIESLRKLMSIVTQEPLLFNDSIYNNIVFGMDNITESQVENAAKIANAHDFILKTENGYQTPIGDRGIKLSGGQKQRVSIARAVLRNPPILILDEATSALDTESEKLVQQSLDTLMKNRTSIVIAHRLSTIRNADLIVVIKDGEIVEKGTHQQLVEIEDGLYKKLNQMQIDT